MEVLWSVGLITLWVVVLVNLLLTLRIERWLREMEDARKREMEMEELPELSVGAPAPDERVKYLSGEPAGLADYAERPVLLLFVSPRCGSCRGEMPMFNKLGANANKRDGVETLLVSDKGTAETHAWINTIRNEDKVDLSLPVLVAPRSTSGFTASYNPRGITPYFCLVDERRTVSARGPVGMGDWPGLQQKWEGPPTNDKPFFHAPRRYR